MKVTILGNNSAIPAHGRHPTAQVISLQNEDILIDCGEGTQMRMQDYDVKRSRINHILISHLHGDHYFGIFGLLTSMSLMQRTAPLHLFAPAPLAPIIQSILAAGETELFYELHFHALPKQYEVIADTKYFTVASFPTEHRIDCHGFLITRKTRGRKILPDRCTSENIPAYFYERLKQGEDYIKPDGTVVPNDSVTIEGPATKRYAYCADTIYTESFLPYIMEADAIYHESTFLEEHAERAAKRHHSTARQAATIAQKAGAKTLLLGHYSSKYKELDEFHNEAAEIFPNVFVTVEGAAYEI